MSDLQALSPEECWEHVRRHHAGRIGFNRGRGDRIHPVSYAVDGDELLLKTSLDSELGMFFQLFSKGALVPFEIDELDQEAEEQWSVLIRGQLRLSEEDPASPGGPPTPDGHDDMRLRLVPMQITGRRLAPDTGASHVGDDG